jgi:hypothetical protein
MAVGEESPAQAGPSTNHSKQRKRRSSSKSSDTPTTQPPSKLTRIDDEDTDMGGAGVDPMEALDTSNGNEDPMEGLEKQVEEVDVPGAVVVRADEFEQEAERVVEAAKGLDGAGDEGQVKLVHQVRHQVCGSLFVLSQAHVRWLFHQDSHMSQYLNINASTLLPERTNSNWILSNTSRRLVLRGTRVCLYLPIHLPGRLWWLNLLLLRV